MRIRKLLQIADLTLTIESDGLPWAYDLEDPHQHFLVKDGPEDVLVKVHWHQFKEQFGSEEIFSLSDPPGRVPPNCRLWRDKNGAWVFEVNTGGFSNGAQLYGKRVVVFSPDFRRGDLYIELARDDQSVYPDPLRMPLERILFVSLMAQHDGMLLHAQGIVRNGKGYVFTGQSGAGKSTLARLWAASGEATVLGEETLILRRRGNEYWVYGTPWIGEEGHSSPQGAPLSGVYFIHHDMKNSTNRLTASRALEKLLTRSYLVAYEPLAARKGLDLGIDLVSVVPMYDFGFLPDLSAVSFILAEDDHG
jgi:hypothetical protein